MTSKDSSQKLQNLVRQLYYKSISNETKPRPDVLFIVGSENVNNNQSNGIIQKVKNVQNNDSVQDDDETQKFYAHKFLLSLRSPYFSSLFDEILEDKVEIQTEIKVTNVDAKTFQNLLRYVYCDELPSNPNEIASTFLAADKFKLDDLCKSLSTLCDSKLTIDNSLVIYDQLLKLHSYLEPNEWNFLIKSCLDVIKMHTFLSFSSKSFYEISKEALIKLIDNDSLFIREIELFEACVKWIKINIKTKDEQRNTLRSIKHLFRFPIMNFSHFEHVIKLSEEIFDKSDDQLFNEQELDEFERFFNTGDLKEISLNYKFNLRNAALIIKIDFDQNLKQFRMFDPFFDDSPGLGNLIEFKQIDSKEFVRVMQRQHGANYNQDCKTKKKLNLAERSHSKDEIYLFKLRVTGLADKESKPERPLENSQKFDGLMLELYRNFVRKHEVNFRKYSKDDQYYFSFDPPIPIQLNNYYRIQFRTLENDKWALAFEVEQISKPTENGGKILDVVLRNDDEVTDHDLIGEMYFYYKTAN